jgi:hypothetical protein
VRPTRSPGLEQSSQPTGRPSMPPGRCLRPSQGGTERDVVRGLRVLDREPAGMAPSARSDADSAVRRPTREAMASGGARHGADSAVEGGFSGRNAGRVRSPLALHVGVGERPPFMSSVLINRSAWPVRLGAFAVPAWRRVRLGLPIRARSALPCGGARRPGRPGPYGPCRAAQSAPGAVASGGGPLWRRCAQRAFSAALVGCCRHFHGATVGAPFPRLTRRRSGSERATSECTRPCAGAADHVVKGFT